MNSTKEITARKQTFTGLRLSKEELSELAFVFLSADELAHLAFMKYRESFKNGKLKVR